MDKNKLKKLLENVREGKIDIDEALAALRMLPFEDLEFARLDNHRTLRTGYPEVIFCKGKTVAQITKIVEKMSKHHSIITATKADRNVYEAVKKIRDDAQYHEEARFILIGKIPEPVNDEKILIITAGTSDIPIAEEAALTVETMGSKVEKIYDVGVAGIHRLFGDIEAIFTAKVIIVIAGMDGALPSIIGGLADKPVIAVPTSVGYGASFEGLAALLTMLNCCAPGVAVMNIDNGFGAGYFASMISNEE